MVLRVSQPQCHTVCCAVKFSLRSEFAHSRTPQLCSTIVAPAVLCVGILACIWRTAPVWGFSPHWTTIGGVLAVIGRLGALPDFLVIGFGGSDC